MSSKKELLEKEYELIKEFLTNRMQKEPSKIQIIEAFEEIYSTRSSFFDSSLAISYDMFKKFKGV